MTVTKIEFKCLKCGNYYDPNTNLECSVCGKKQKVPLSKQRKTLEIHS